MSEKVFIEEAGCNRRKLDVEKIRSYLRANGYDLVDRPDDADRVLVVTCAFKQSEEDASVERLRQHRDSGSRLVVYGCLPDIAQERYAEFREVPSIAPRQIDQIESLFPKRQVSYSAVQESNLIGDGPLNPIRSIARFFRHPPRIDHALWIRLRSGARRFLSRMFKREAKPCFLFVCRGCLGHCTYCGIRKSIGSVKSKQIEEVCAEFRRGVHAGYREFTILGDDPGCYGLDIGATFPALMQALLASAANIDAIPAHHKDVRKPVTFLINEIHPKYLIAYADQLLSMAGFRNVRSILCPVQSGSNRILDLMQREHSVKEFEDALRKIRDQHPQMVFNSQVIVGFPSETEEEFEETLDLVTRCRFGYVVVFPFDEKEGTIAKSIDGKVPDTVIRQRMKRAFRYFGRTGTTAYYQCP